MIPNKMCKNQIKCNSYRSNFQKLKDDKMIIYFFGFLGQIGNFFKLIHRNELAY